VIHRGRLHRARGVEHDRDRAAEIRAGRGRIEVDGQRLGDLGGDPAACTERLRSAEHEQPAADIVHIGAQQAVELRIDRPAWEIRKHDRVEPGQVRAVRVEVGWPDDDRGDGRLGERRHERRALRATRGIDHQHARGAFDEGHCGADIVLEHAVLREVARFEDRLEAVGACVVERERQDDRPHAGLERDGKPLARRRRIEIDQLARIA
jgi:hypothetical protein